MHNRWARIAHGLAWAIALVLVFASGPLWVFSRYYTVEWATDHPPAMLTHIECEMGEVRLYHGDARYVHWDRFWTKGWKAYSRTYDTRWMWRWPYLYDVTFAAGSTTSAMLPLWMPLGVGFIGVVVLTPWRALVSRLRRLLRSPGKCYHCKYDLTGNTSGVCPECGTRVKSPAIGSNAEYAPTRQGLSPPNA